MKLIYKGKYNGDVNTLPHGEHKPGAVKFKEFDDAKTLGIVANVIALVITVGLFFYFWEHWGHFVWEWEREIIIMFSMR